MGSRRRLRRPGRPRHDRTAVRRLLGGHRYSFFEPASWSQEDGSPIGAVLQVHLAPRASYEEDWPLVGCAPHAAYSLSVVHFAVANMSELMISVHTRLGRVVGVDPTDASPDDPDPQVDEGTARSVVPEHPAGDPGEADCSSHG
jgi:hypothetical protein